MMLVTAPGSGPERDLVHRDHPAEGDREPLHGERLSGIGPGEEPGDVEVAGAGGPLVDAAEPPLDLAHHPAGVATRTMRSSSPTKSSRYSARAERNSGSSTTTRAPTTGPRTVPIPPMMATRRKRIDWRKGNDSGLMKFVREAKIAPASPEIAADSVNAVVRIMTGSSPSDRDASSESRTARMALPQALALRRVNRATAPNVRRATSSATSRSMKV